jgi:hypothetical protein
MESGHRYRLLIYFAALVLCLSVCFAYAESPASLPTVSYTPSDCTVTPAAQPARLLFNTAPGRSSFMPALTATLVIEADSMQEEQPVMTADAVLHGLNVQADHSHSLLHGIFPSHHKLKLVKTHAQEHLSAAAGASPQMTGDESEAR